MDHKERVIRAAGILEGEGTFVAKAGREYYPHVACAMTDSDVISELRDLFGGSICRPSKKKAHYKDVWLWSISGLEAVTVLRSIRPYMFSRRRERIDSLLQKWSAWEESTGREQKVFNDRVDKAAKEYVRSGGRISYRRLAEKHDVGWNTIRKRVIKAGYKVQGG